MELPGTVPNTGQQLMFSFFFWVSDVFKGISSKIPTSTMKYCSSALKELKLKTIPIRLLLFSFSSGQDSDLKRCHTIFMVIINDNLPYLLLYSSRIQRSQTGNCVTKCFSISQVGLPSQPDFSSKLQKET